MRQGVPMAAEHEGGIFFTEIQGNPPFWDVLLRDFICPVGKLISEEGC